MKVKYGIRARGVTNLLERQLQEEWWRSVNQKNVFACVLQDIKNIFVKNKKKYEQLLTNRLLKIEQL